MSYESIIDQLRPYLLSTDKEQAGKMLRSFVTHDIGFLSVVDKDPELKHLALASILEKAAIDGLRRRHAEALTTIEDTVAELAKRGLTP